MGRVGWHTGGMTTDTMDDEEVEAEEDGEEFDPQAFMAERKSIYTDPAPSSAYDGCNDARSVDNKFRELFAQACIDNDCTPFRLPRLVNQALGEDARRAHWRYTHGKRGPTEKRVKVQEVARPVEHEDGSLTITCAGPCGQEQSHKKFPTLKTGGRGNVCRSCADALKAERKGK